MLCSWCEETLQDLYGTAALDAEPHALTFTAVLSPTALGMADESLTDSAGGEAPFPLLWVFICEQLSVVFSVLLFTVT